MARGRTSSSRSRLTGAAGLLVIALAVLTACTVASDEAAGPTTSSPSAAAAPSPVSPTPTPTPAASQEPRQTPEPVPPAPQPETPLVLATHLTVPELRLTADDLRRLQSDGLTPEGIERLGGAATALVVGPSVDPPPGASQVPTAADVVDAVRGDPRTVGLLAADAMDPTVRAARVDDVDPLRDPLSYPVMTNGQSPQAVVTISIGGDVMMDRRVGQSLEASGDYAAPFRPMADRLAAADITLVNLESTLAELGPPTQGIESFVADPRIRSGLTLAGVDVVSLANNHSGDYGPTSLLTTIDLLRDGGFAVFGAGADGAQADKPAVLIRDGVTVAFVGFNAIGETPAAGPGQPGASALSMPPRTGPVDTQRLDQITAQVGLLATRVDVVVVVPHWGTQYTAEPVAEQAAVGQALLEAGADIVVGGHPHWVQAVERSPDGRLVVHSLGNLVFDMDFSVETMEGVVAELVVWDDRVVAVDYVPYVIGGDWVPRWVDPDERGEPILRRMWQASDQPFASLG